ncbi:hypothetical protein QAD02_004720 [Eretmocerus hayati]|uniref:Uncharacterized protein n=1 Tax=Eretmocerus hayati TaxID=131215 RepID=A0ACC2NRJ3_9HYME|nr:hypothetical protein QAD02_004720 [Eretmocerus hayati]
MSFPEGGTAYFSITDILVTEERISCELRERLPSLGFLSASSKGPDLDPGAKLELPLWLAEALHRGSQQGQLIACETPKTYRDNYREILHADAPAVELSKWGLHYYELGLRIPKLLGIEARQLPEFLLDSFRVRFRIIVDIIDPMNPHRSTMLTKAQLASLERKLLATAMKEFKCLSDWLNRGVKRLQSSNVIENIRKRKRMDV